MRECPRPSLPGWGTWSQMQPSTSTSAPSATSTQRKKPRRPTALVAFGATHAVLRGRNTRTEAPVSRAVASHRSGAQEGAGVGVGSAWATVRGMLSRAATLSIASRGVV